MDGPITVLQLGSARRSSLPACRRGTIDDDAAAFLANVAAAIEVAQNSTHHLARGTDAIREVLLRQPLGDNVLAIDILRQLEQHSRHAAVDVKQREAANALGESACAAHHVANEEQCELGIACEKLL